jgi:hypothetical protein
MERCGNFLPSLFPQRSTLHMARGTLWNELETGGTFLESIDILSGTFRLPTVIGNCGTTGTAGRTTLGRLAIAPYGRFNLSASTPFAFPGRQAWMLHLILPERVGQRSKELLIV